MLQRMFGRRRPPPEPEENIEGGFVLLCEYLIRSIIKLSFSNKVFFKIKSLKKKNK